VFWTSPAVPKLTSERNAFGSKAIEARLWLA
jgi:hypothetical protein